MLMLMMRSDAAEGKDMIRKNLIMGNGKLWVMGNEVRL